MKKYVYVLIDIVIVIIFLSFILITYAMDEYQLPRIILGCISLLILATAIITYILSIKKDKIPIALPIFALILIYVSGIDSHFYSEANGTTHPPYSISIWIFVIVSTLLLSSITVLIAHRKKSLKKYINSFLVNSVMYFVICFMIIFSFANYAFDLSKPSEESFIVKEQLDGYNRGSGEFGSYYYTVEYIGTNDNVLIYEIELKSEYKYESGDHIKLKFRKGLFQNLYKVDYTNAKLDDEILFASW